MTLLWRKSAVVFVFLSILWTSSAVRTVTNEDIRDAILSVVHMIRTSEDKLERHEYRERNLGDQVKKSLVTLDKRIKLLDPVKGTISRLDERLATVETILMQKDERERIQLQKTFDTVEDIQKNLPLIMDKMKQDILDKLSSSTPQAPSQTSNDDVKKLEKKIDDVASSIKKLETDLSKIQEDNKNFQRMNGNYTKKLNESEELLEKYEQKLNEMNNKVPILADESNQKVFQDKFLQALDVQKTNMEQILSDMKNVASKVQKLPEKRDLENAHNATMNGLEKVKESTKSNGVDPAIDEKLKDIKNDVQEKHKVIADNLADIEDIVKSIKVEIGVNGKQINDKQDGNIKKADLEKVIEKIDMLSSKLKDLPDKDDMASTHKETLKKLDEISVDGPKQPMVQDAGLDTVDMKLSQLKHDSEKRHQELINILNEMGNSSDTFAEIFGNNYLQLANDLEKITKLHEIIVQTDDGVRDTKRRVEYGVHQTVGELSELMRKYARELNSTINDRFDNFEVDMFGEENGALANFTVKIGKEIDKVWKQIGIMHQQMSASAETLNTLLNYTDHYANSSINVMDGMKGKVGTIKDKMLEVDDNLNFLLGKLHLVTQEFNMVRNELGKVLDDIKNNFKKIKTEPIGPGPHQIDDNTTVEPA